MIHEIKKAKFFKKTQKLEIHYIKMDDKKTKSTVKEENEAPMHPDLMQAFNNLRVHLSILGGHLKAKEIENISLPDDEILNPYHVSGFAIGGNDDPGVVLTGHMILPDGKAVIINTPFYRFTENEETRYMFMDDLIEKLDRIDVELRAYMDGSKRGMDAQLNLPFDENEPVVNKARILPEEKKLFKTPGASKMPDADPEAIKRVAKDIADAEIIEEMPDKKEIKKKPGRGKKKVPQSAEAPGGEIEE